MSSVKLYKLYDTMAQSNHIESKCLHLGPSSIGSKAGNLGGDVIDDIAKQKLGFLPDGMLKEIEKYLKDRFPEVYNNNLDKVISVPENYDYGVETKKGMKARAMQYGDENEARKRIAELANSSNPTDKREKRHLEQILTDTDSF